MAQSHAAEQAPVDITVQIMEAHLRAGGGFLMDIARAAELINVGRTKMSEMISTGEVPSVLVGGKRQVSIKQLLEYLQGAEANARWRR